MLVVFIHGDGWLYSFMEMSLACLYSFDMDIAIDFPVGSATTSPSMHHPCHPCKRAYEHTERSTKRASKKGFAGDEIDGRSISIDFVSRINYFIL